MKWKRILILHILSAPSVLTKVALLYLIKAVVYCSSPNFENSDVINHTFNILWLNRSRKNLFKMVCKRCISRWTKKLFERYEGWCLSRGPRWSGISTPFVWFGRQGSEAHYQLSSKFTHTNYPRNNLRKRLLLEKVFCFYVLLFIVDQATEWKFTECCLND